MLRSRRKGSRGLSPGPLPAGPSRAACSSRTPKGPSLRLVVPGLFSGALALIKLCFSGASAMAPVSRLPFLDFCYYNIFSPVVKGAFLFILCRRKDLVPHGTRESEENPALMSDSNKNPGPAEPGPGFSAGISAGGSLREFRLRKNGRLRHGPPSPPCIGRTG
jgi:hypothetical protein